MWYLLQCAIIFAVAASNIRWHWTPNGYLVGLVGVGLAYGLTLLINAIPPTFGKSARLNERIFMILRASSAAVVLALLGAPALARPRVVAPPQPTVSTYCATIDPGNPFSKVYDYQAWSAWRAKGDWDSRGDNACARNPLYSPPGTPTFRPIPYPNPSWF